MQINLQRECNQWANKPAQLFTPKSCILLEKIHNVELHHVYYWQNIFFPVTKSIEIRWAGNVERMGGEERWIHEFGGGNLKESDHLEDLGVDSRIIILKWILNEVVGYVWSGLIWLRTETNTRLSVDACKFPWNVTWIRDNNFGTLCIYSQIVISSV